jgi:hypothetical protein
MDFKEPILHVVISLNFSMCVRQSHHQKDPLGVPEWGVELLY